MSEDGAWEYVMNQRPSRKGWYPVAWSVDPMEGFFPGAGYWTGLVWKKLVDAHLGSENPSFIGLFYRKQYGTSAKALEFAVENDPGL